MLLLQTGCDDSSSPPLERWGIVNSTEFGRLPRWSPDGAHILYGDDRLGEPGLWIWKPGEAPTRLGMDLPPHDWGYRWSAAADFVAFSTPGESGSEEAGVWVVEVANGLARRIIDRGRDVSWNSTGEYLLIRIDNPAAGDPGIYRVEVSTGVAELLVADGYKPSCSPLGDWTAYSDGEIDGRLMLHDGDDVQPVTDQGAVQWEWAAGDNTLFAVVNDYTSGSLKGTLWRIRIEGGTVRVDSSLTNWAAFPAPNGDGSEVAFLRTSNARWVGLWIHRVGGNEPQIYDYAENPHFNPVGNSIAINAPGGGIRVLQRVN